MIELLNSRSTPPTPDNSESTTKSAETDQEGVASIYGLDAGDYGLSAHFGPLDVSGFLQPQDVIVSVPGPEVTVVLTLPNIAWAKPRTGKVVVGYFRVPIGRDDFDRSRQYLRRIEQQCQQSHQGSLANAFLSNVDEVDLIALVDPGGWMTARVPVFALAGDSAPTSLPNPSSVPVSYGNLSVSARSVGGEPLRDAPFALSMANAGSHGSITLPIEYDVSQSLPAGTYTFVALQADVSSLFRGPQHAVAIEDGGNVSVTLQATRAIRRVALTVEQWAHDGTRMDTIGTVRVSDGLGFSTEWQPTTEDEVWLPTGQTLTARTRTRVGILYVNFVCEFFVPDQGSELQVIRLQERP